MTSSISSVCKFRLIVPFSIFVIESRFSTRLISQAESSAMSAISWRERVESNDCGLFNRIPALPEMLVSGVRRSWEIERSRLARSCSFFTCIWASSLRRASVSLSSASAPSLSMESTRLFSNGSSGSPFSAIPTTPYTVSAARMAR